MATVWIVTDGDYSDYHICGVFSSESKAKEFVGGSGARIEPYELDAQAGRGFLARYTCYLNLETGEVTNTYGPIWEERDEHTRGESGIVWRKQSKTDRLYNISRMSEVFGHSFESEEHAMKLAVEKRQAWLRAGKPEDFE